MTTIYHTSPEEIKENTMKQLKTSTIKRYSNKQLVRHFDRSLDLFNTAPFRITGCGKVFEYDPSNNCYFFSFNTEDRDTLIVAIEAIHRTLETRTL